MDWIKAKNILIIALIATNIFLVFSAENMAFSDDKTRIKSDDFYEYAVSFLEERGLWIETDVPKNNILMPIITVEYELFEHDKVAKLFLGANYEIVNETTFKNKDKVLKIEGDKKLIFFDYSNENVENELSKDRVKELSENFLCGHLLMREGLVLEEIKINKTDEGSLFYEVVFGQKYNEFFLEKSYVHVFIDERGVFEARAKLLEVTGVKEQKKDPIRAIEAIVKALGKIKDENEEEVTVIKIELGYYFDIKDSEVSDWDTIKAGTAMPTWRITLKNGKKYYITAVKN
ncbi:MAG: two-component system regulatory protein YycI [Alkaliphilus sp.]